MSDQKKINIDMNLFNTGGGRTRKKKPGEKKEGGIKIKQPSQKKKNDTLKKKSILKMIRQHQETRYNNLFDSKKEPEKKDDSTGGFNKDFEEAQKFMQNLTEKTTTSLKNTTLKQYPNASTNSLLMRPFLDPLKNTATPEPLKDLANTFIASSNITLKPMFNNVNNVASASPQFGCLKNGELPTYRNYMNKTQKNTIPQPVVGGSPQKTVTELRNDIMEKKLGESMNRVNEMKSIEQKLQQIRTNAKPKKMKQKKTIRRTYKIGKSKMAPKVSVLFSNKTIRNNITTKSQLLKQSSIEDVKKHLIKHGLIKVGTIAPNDVLRKMYESSIMMCGELQNHNPDYLLHNFINGPK